MSTINKGLRADKMRKHMLDKALIKHTGGLYVGSTATVTYYASNTVTTSGKEITELFPTENNAGNVLCSQGDDATIAYTPLPNAGFADGSVSKGKTGSGAIVSRGDNKIYFAVEKNEDTGDIEITFTPTNN